METLGYLAHGMATAFEPFNFAVMIIGLFIAIHLFLVVWHGISEPPERKK